MLILLKRGLFTLRRRLLARRLPQIITRTTFDPRGVRFEASGATELWRIVTDGGEKEFVAAMLRTLQPDDVLYDIGANIGLVALHAGSRCQTIAFEPDPGFRGRLLRNLELNPSVSVDVRAEAVGADDAVATLFTDGAQGSSPSLSHEHGEHGAIQVQGCTLDALTAAGGIPPPTVLKIDIEGAEILALRGADRLLNGASPPRALFLEIHDTLLPAFGSSADEVLRLVRNAGYEHVIYEARRSDQSHLIVTRHA